MTFILQKIKKCQLDQNMTVTPAICLQFICIDAKPDQQTLHSKVVETCLQYIKAIPSSPRHFLSPDNFVYGFKLMISQEVVIGVMLLSDMSIPFTLLYLSFKN